MTTNTRTGRPYYQSSKEQYDLLVSIVRHFRPDAVLDKENLRVLAEGLRSNEVATSSAVPSQPPNADSHPGSCPTAVMPSSPVPVDVQTQSNPTFAPGGNTQAQDDQGPVTNLVPSVSLRADPIAINGSTDSRPGVWQTDPMANGPQSSNGALPPFSGTSETFPIESVPRKDVMDIISKLLHNPSPTSHSSHLLRHQGMIAALAGRPSSQKSIPSSNRNLAAYSAARPSSWTKLLVANKSSSSAQTICRPDIYLKKYHQNSSTTSIASTTS